MFFLSQNSDKTDCKSSVLWVQISCCLFLLVFPSLKVCVCCRFCLSKDRLCWLPFIAYYFFYSKYIYFRYQNTKKFLIDVVSVYTLVNAWPCVASFCKLWWSSVQIFLIALILSQYELLSGIKCRNLANSCQRLNNIIFEHWEWCLQVLCTFNEKSFNFQDFFCTRRFHWCHCLLHTAWSLLQ